MSKRKSIPEAVRLRLWVASAGRCEFKGCNEYVWRNGLTLSEGNFADVAHIIASSEDGPRGNQDSEDAQVDFKNLMLLCKKCHKEIDDNPELYSASLLQAWKKEHENRIEIQTSYTGEIHESTILMFTVNIGDRQVPISLETVRAAMLPRYPVDLKGIRIKDSDFDKRVPYDQWMAFAKNKIERKIQRALEEGIDDQVVKHISVFAIAPMPLLMYLGKCIGDTVPTDIYQSHRDIKKTDSTWSWKDEKELSYIIRHEKKRDSKTILLKLEISDFISEDKYHQEEWEDANVYQITIPNPSPHCMSSRKSLENFAYSYRDLLNRIQKEHGKDCKIYILPAVPVSVAVQAGRALLPNKDPEIYVCEYYGGEIGFKTVLRLN
ncbi:MAG: SAVED domain-containing protein [Geitlerinemataceae cyanobacterium]